MKGILGLLGRLARSAGSSAIGTATVLGVAGAMQPGVEGGPQLQGATLQNPVFEVNESRSILGLQLDGGSEFFWIGGGALILTILVSFCCSGWGCRACRALNRRRTKLKEMKEEKLEQKESRETDRDLETAMQRLRTKLGRSGKGTERGGGQEVFTNGLDF